MNPIVKHLASKDFIYVWYKESNIYINDIRVYRKVLDIL
jgi:hypothetical protein